MNFIENLTKKFSFSRLVYVFLSLGILVCLASRVVMAVNYTRDHGDDTGGNNWYEKVRTEAPGFVESNTNFEIKRSLDESVQTGEVNLDSWMVGTLEDAKEEGKQGWTGTMDALLYWFNKSLGGPGLYKATSSGGSTSLLPGGALGDTANIVSLAFVNQPVSSVDYIADLGENMGFSKPAYAQGGIGFQGLQPVLELWKAFRNIAYLFFALVFVVIGLAIMFRVKINPQTVVSVQNAIPQIIIALLLVTFSYAIAGFMIDLAYVAMFLLLEIFGKVAVDQNQTYYHIWQAASGEGGAATSIGLTEFAPFLDLFSKLAPLVVGSLAAMAAVMTVPLLNVIILVMLLYTMIRIIILLITTYVKIIFAVIFAPLQLALGAIPGQAGFGKWFRNLLSNVAVLPTVFAMFLLTAFFLTSSIGADAATSSPAEGFAKFLAYLSLGVTTGPIGLILSTVYGFLAGAKEVSSEEVLRGAFASGWGILSFGVIPLLGMGTFFLIPKAGEMVRDALQVKPWPYGTGFGEAFAPVGKAGGMAVKAGSAYGKMKVGEKVGVDEDEALKWGWPALGFKGYSEWRKRQANTPKNP